MATNGGGGVGAAPSEAQQRLASAERALSLGNFAAAKRHAESAIDADPLVDGVDEILAVADVHLAAKSRVNNQPNWYAVLQLPSDADPAAVSRSYRRLTLLLNPSRNPNPKAEIAARLVADAFAVLSDPSKKSLFDAKLSAGDYDADDDGAAAVEVNPFWTACVSCFRVHLYDREYLNLSVRCSTCRRPFRAAELLEPPTIVPGTDTYYCSWGFYPLGYPGGPEFKCPEGVGIENPNFGKEWNAFYPVVSSSKLKNDENPGNAAEAAKTGTGTGPKKRTKTVVRRNLRGGLRKPHSGSGRRGAAATAAADVAGVVPQASGLRPLNVGEEVVEVGGIDVNIAVGGMNINSQVRGPVGGVAGNVGAMPFHIDMDATDEILRNLHNLPFLKDDIRLRMMP